MAKTSILKTVWSQRFMGNLDNYLTFASPFVCNNWYEGDAATSNVVRINQIGAVQVGSYTGAAITHQELTSSNSDLTINQAKYFSVKVDDVDKVQSQLNLIEGVMERAAYAVGNTIDAYIAGTVFADASTSSTIGISGSAKIATGSTAVNTLIDAGALLTTAGVPIPGRYAILSPGYVAELQKQTTSVGFDISTIKNGLVPGMNVAGFQIFISQNLTTYGSGATKEFVNFVGHPMCTTFAMGLREMETVRHPDYFNDVVKGLVVYGGKMTNTGGVYSLVARYS